MKSLGTLLLALALLLPLQSQAATVSSEAITCSVTSPTRLVEKGTTVTVSWTSTGSIFTYGPEGTRIPASGTMQVTPTETTIYKFKFLGIGGNEKCGVRIRVIGDTVPQ